MKNIIHIIIVVLLFPIACRANDAIRLADISFINHVEQCIGLSPDRVYKTKNGTVLVSRTDFKKVTGHCGCKNSLLSYRVTEIPDVNGPEIRLDRMHSMINSRTAKDKALEFMITSDPDIRYAGKIEIVVGCQPAD